MLGVDRLDMIKGIPQKLLAFEKFLVRWACKPCLCHKHLALSATLSCTVCRRTEGHGASRTCVPGIQKVALVIPQEENPEWRDRVLLVQIAVPSRTDVPEYQVGCAAPADAGSGLSGMLHNISDCQLQCLVVCITSACCRHAAVLLCFALCSA